VESPAVDVCGWLAALDMFEGFVEEGIVIFGAEMLFCLNILIISSSKEL